MIGKLNENRVKIIIGIIILLIVLIFIRLINLQIINGASYKEQSEKRLLKSLPVTASRGDITDRYGRPLVTNRMGFNIIFQKEYIEDDKLNELILNTIKILEQYGQSYYDTLPITAEGVYSFTSPNYTKPTEKENIDYFLGKNQYKKGMTAKEVLAMLKDKYEVDDKYDTETQRKIIGVRYEMEARSFNSFTPYTFASDISMEVVSYIREQSEKFKGVNISVEPIRVNVNGTIASHILGRVGIIYKEEYDELKSKGYGMNDIIGKEGIEKIMEEYLKGKDGAQSTEQSINGSTINVLETEPAVPGNNVALTIDLELQKIAEESLAQTVTQICGGFGATAGAVAVVDVNNGEVLALASYPTFNQNTFNQDYKQLSENPAKPMWNRAISGTYAPGSTFKMLTAVAALESGVINTKEQINDTGIYKYYESAGYAPVCWYYDDYGIGHGPQNVSQAIENSCNYYFYEVGRRMGIDKLAEYGKKFGLGEYTGSELTGEAKGIFASKEYREKISAVWYPGDTLQAAIGQSDHLFTPLQLANYVATVVNGGTRYKVHLIKEVKSNKDSKVVLRNEAEVVDKVDISPENYNAIIQGMKAVSETGTASNVFADFEIPVGGKTGTASVPTGTANALFVAAAPLDNPQIAIAIVVEHGAHGNYVAPIAKKIIRYYMEPKIVNDENKTNNRLIP